VNFRCWDNQNEVVVSSWQACTISLRFAWLCESPARGLQLFSTSNTITLYSSSTVPPPSQVSDVSFYHGPLSTRIASRASAVWQITIVITGRVRNRVLDLDWIFDNRFPLGFDFCTSLASCWSSLIWIGILNDYVSHLDVESYVSVLESLDRWVEC
jgi:hypothetical protein